MILILLIQLRQDNEEIKTFDEKLKKIANEMLLVMYASNGIGLAAPQVFTIFFNNKLKL